MTVGLPLTIPNALARTARWFGDGEAVVDSATRLTFAELDKLSCRAAALFAALGAVPGELLALLCPPSAIYLVAWLGAVQGHRTRALGVEKFGQTGTLADLYRHAGIDAQAIAAAAQAITPGRPIRHLAAVSSTAA